MKFANLNAPELINDLPRFLNVPGHFDKAPFFLTPDMFGGLSFSIAGGHIESLVGIPVAEVHVHDVPEIYLLLSPDNQGAEIDIEVEGKMFSMTSPGAFYIPAHKRHRFITKKAQKGSFCLGILLEPDSHGKRP